MGWPTATAQRPCSGSSARSTWAAEEDIPRQETECLQDEGPRPRRRQCVQRHPDPEQMPQRGDARLDGQRGTYPLIIGQRVGPQPSGHGPRFSIGHRTETGSSAGAGGRLPDAVLAASAAAKQLGRHVLSVHSDAAFVELDRRRGGGRSPAAVGSCRHASAPARRARCARVAQLCPADQEGQTAEVHRDLVRPGYPGRRPRTQYWNDSGGALHQRRRDAH